ncbi:MAG: hypothetical protein K8H99_07225, partial [Nitrospirae bacterium]|nr:hypothetical protein [Fimbriimonadaceae bacterium]
ICPFCVETYEPSEKVIETLGLPMVDGKPPQLARGKGCSRCGNRGLKGRTGVYEVMPITQNLRDMVLAKASGADLKRQAIADGMQTMYDIGVQKVMDRITTPEEVIRVLMTED